MTWRHWTDSFDFDRFDSGSAGSLFFWADIEADDRGSASAMFQHERTCKNCTVNCCLLVTNGYAGSNVGCCKETSKRSLGSLNIC